MPPIEVDSPLATGFGAAAGALNGIEAGKQQAAEKKRQDELDRQNAIAQAAVQAHMQAQDKLQQDEFGLKQQEFTQEQTDKENAAKLSAKKEADEALHQAREDAIAKAKVNLEATHDKQAYDLALRKISASYTIAAMKAKTATTVADIRANAAIGAATIRASATIEAANIRNQGANARAGEHDTTVRRGQDLNAQTRDNAINATNQRGLQSAMTRLSTMKGAPVPPTPDEDPKFAQAAAQFYHDSPADRAKLISNPNVPPATRAYFQALSGVLSAAPTPVALPAWASGAAGGDDDEDDQ